MVTDSHFLSSLTTFIRMKVVRKERKWIFLSMKDAIALIWLLTAFIFVLICFNPPSLTIHTQLCSLWSEFVSWPIASWKMVQNVAFRHWKSLEKTSNAQLCSDKLPSIHTGVMWGHWPLYSVQIQGASAKTWRFFKMLVEQSQNL